MDHSDTTCSQLEDVSHNDIKTSQKVKIYSTFETMGLKKEILQGIYAYGKLLATFA